MDFFNFPELSTLNLIIVLFLCGITMIVMMVGFYEKITEASALEVTTEKEAKSSISWLFIFPLAMLPIGLLQLLFFELYDFWVGFVYWNKLAVFMGLGVYITTSYEILMTGKSFVKVFYLFPIMSIVSAIIYFIIGGSFCNYMGIYALIIGLSPLVLYYCISRYSQARRKAFFENASTATRDLARLFQNASVIRSKARDDAFFSLQNAECDGTNNEIETAKENLEHAEAYLESSEGSLASIKKNIAQEIDRLRAMAKTASEYEIIKELEQHLLLLDSSSKAEKMENYVKSFKKFNRKKIQL